jgi:cell wall-associated NlpC family hydrolase
MGWLVLLLGTSLLGGCAGRSVRVAVPDTRPTSDAEIALRVEVGHRIGTPHCASTTEELCTDCSGLVVDIYAKLFGIALPRRAVDIAGCGAEVEWRDLRAGDLVFFHISRKTSHVGIYLNDGEFAHTSSSRGVMISRLSERYWAKRFWTARRVMG